MSASELSLQHQRRVRCNQPGGEVPSPRLQRILASLDFMPSASILSCEAAASMDVEAFGERTEAVREWVLHELAASASWRVSQSAAPSTLAARPCTTMVVATAPQPRVCCTSAAADTTLAIPAAQTTIALAPCSAAAAAAAAGLTLRAAVLEPEELDILSAVDDFFNTIPRALLLHAPSALTDDERVAARRRHLVSCGASSISAGTLFVREWVAFCARRGIPAYGVPADADLLSVFLAEVDTAARHRASNRSRQTGASVQHAMACAARWVTDHAGLPFDVAKSRHVRKSSAPAREAEPSWSEMWEPAVLPHLLRVALDERHRGLVRAMAAATYFVCVASMRLVNGLRSGPPVLDDQGVFHGLAALSKGRRRSAMAPRPWSVPSVSPDGLISDVEVLRGLQAAISQLPQGCCSMFPRLLDAAGREVALERAVVACPSARASDSQLETTVMFLLTLPPLSLSKQDARRIAARKHGPRHMLPEIARVMGLPVAARHELGQWASSASNRLQTMSNRYSRDAERLLSSTLRSVVLRHIRSRMPHFQRIDLRQLVATPDEMQSAFDTAQSALSNANSILHLEGHTGGGSA